MGGLAFVEGEGEDAGGELGGRLQSVVGEGFEGVEGGEG